MLMEGLPSIAISFKLASSITHLTCSNEVCLKATENQRRGYNPL